MGQPKGGGQADAQGGACFDRPLGCLHLDRMRVGGAAQTAMMAGRPHPDCRQTMAGSQGFMQYQANFQRSSVGCLNAGCLDQAADPP